MTAIAEGGATTTTMTDEAMAKSTGHGGGHWATKTATDVAIRRASDAGRGRQIPPAGLAAIPIAAGSAKGAVTERGGTDVPPTMTESTHHIAVRMAIATMAGQRRRAEPAPFSEAALFHRRKPLLR